ncbi:VCBS repeat-containing protein [Altibacter sp. HG106]|uniref:VCBS repeat-containing protein n=1 Tax=Altibacter sp. HG106 TaxID=3023937 RepID=UPI0023501A5C|nr:VCBS repeat-containing protein [Altibacter sp. HG106]MDC7994254.1 VCBS repeat-containing protein [Altibacter sp. HG106]
MSKTLLLLWLVLVIVACESASEEVPVHRLFKTMKASALGIDYRHQLKESDSLNILDYLYFYNGGGLAMGDINNDGLPDLFFSSNQGPNKLYINKGDLSFEDISEKAGIQGKSSWNTGAVMADVNGDGLLDIYVLAVVGINGFQGHNELFINQGDLTFVEASKAHGLDLSAYGTTAAFFDYDLDGDLDAYVLNHAVHTQESFGRAQIRNRRNPKSGDRLLQNNDGRFTDVSAQAGIFGGDNGYGLGLSVSDFNQDGYPDIYVGNDFHEDDYYYVNNGDGTFTERLKTHFGHTSRFSMGNAVGDVNRDGRPDLISLDMLPQDETVLKSSEGDDTYHTLKMRTEQFGYHYQYARNMLFLNQASGNFSEQALQSGIAATDWSWSALFADFNQDGYEDLFISNGIPKRPNDLDFIRFASNEQIQKKMSESRLVDQQALEMMPSGAVANYVYQGTEEGTFKDQSTQWLKETPSISGATAIGDLDGDGDLDVVTQNINNVPTVYINQTNQQQHYLKLQFQYAAPNTAGIGTKAMLFTEDGMQFRELYPNKGWQATSENVLHFGIPAQTKVDSLQIIWPNRTLQTLVEPSINTTLAIAPKQTIPWQPAASETNNFEWKRASEANSLAFTHREDTYSDFNVQKLIPYQLSDRGPALALGDLDNNGTSDIFFGGAVGQPASVFLQQGNGFQPHAFPELRSDSLSENVTAAILDVNKDGYNDILIGNGGNRVQASLQDLKDFLYLGSEEGFQKKQWTDEMVNTAVITASEQEGFVFVGNHSKPLDFGKKVSSYLFKISSEELLPMHQKIEFEGMVTDALWTDFDKDGDEDLLVVGEWMPPTFLENREGHFHLKNLEGPPLFGLWQTVAAHDMDHDGDMDYVLGNWGLNSKLKASTAFPLHMYYDDFDANGTSETVIAIEKNGSYYPLLGLNELAEQLVYLRKKFVAYSDFAGKDIKAVFGEAALQKAVRYEVTELASGYLRNDNGRFSWHPLEGPLQIAPLTAFASVSEKEYLLAGGNYFGVIPFHGRFDSFSGSVIHSEKEHRPAFQYGIDFYQKSVRHLRTLMIDQKEHLLVVYNNETSALYELDKNTP